MWTPESYDRCLLFALFYPRTVLFIIWTITGAIGPAEQALGFSETLGDGVRYAIAVGLLVLLFLCNKFTHSEGLVQLLYLLGIVTSADTVPGLIVFAVSVVFAIGVAVFFAVVFSAILILKTIDRRQKGTVMVIYTLLLMMILVITPALHSHSTNWDNAAPLLLFFGVLVVVNAPLDSLTLGVTRALLWRGVDQRGVWPFLWGLVDIVIALIILVVLSVLMILAIQLFNAAALFGVQALTDPAIIEAAVFLDPAELVAGMVNGETRAAPEYWWVYATLFSTLLPSWVHLLVASGCFVRGSTRLNQLIGDELPQGKAGESLLPHTLTKLAALLALQRTFGLALATAVFFGSLWCLFFLLFPQITPRLLYLAVPLSGSDWATGFVRTIADMIETLRSNLLSAKSALVLCFL